MSAVTSTPQVVDVDTDKVKKSPKEWYSFESTPTTSSGLPAHIDVPDTFVSRKLDEIIESLQQNEGMGARVRRSIGRQELQNFDPFLMLDEFRSADENAGFPDHPHRGFETVSFLLPTSKGSFHHEDFAGHSGTIGPGDVQWMTAGRGILHSEIPASSLMTHGLQLWVNLSSKDKMVKPAYQELKSHQIPHVKSDGVRAIVIAGTALGVSSPVKTRTPTYYIHFVMEKNSILKQPIPQGWNSFIYTLHGKCYVGSDKETCLAEAHHTITLKQHGDGVLIQTKDDGVEFVLIAGKPIGEPIVQHGPFVMNTREQIVQAFMDFQSGKNGFERAIGWKSEFGTKFMDKKKKKGKGKKNYDDDQDD